MKISKVKLLQASQVAMSIRYVRQQYFMHSDKSNKMLARLLAQACPKTSDQWFPIKEWKLEV